LARAVDSAPTRRLRRGPLTRSQILDASLKLFSDRGFTRTSVRDIAQAAGITDAAIYYHFASKRELFEALIEERGFTAALEDLEKAELTVGPREAVVGMATNALAFIYQNRDLMKVLMLEAMAEDAVATEEYRVLVQRWERGLVRIIRRYADQGLLRTDAPEALAAQLAVTVIGAFADYMMMTPTADRPDTVPPDLMCRVEAAMHNIVRGVA
jgi:AcrR family transcriptional regulator